MEIEFDVLKSSRKVILKLIDGLSLEQLHAIPKGFNNNITWNVAHLVVTQQLLHYNLSNLNCLVPEELIEKYRKGTYPSETFTQEKFNQILELFIGLPDILVEDYKEGIFKNYNEYKTSTGFELNSIERAIAFNNLHEGIHIGAVLSLKKFV